MGERGSHVGSHVLSCSDLFSGAVTIVIPWTDDQIVRCGLRSLGRGRLEQMVAIGAVRVRVMRVFSASFTLGP